MFKKVSKLTLVVFALGTASSLVAKVPTYWWKSTLLEITTASPPALVYVTDSQGHVTGADINSPVNQYGEQDIKFLLQNIPHSGVVQTNIADNDTNQSSSNTPWDINIMDGGAQSYGIHLVGTANDVEEIVITLVYHAPAEAELNKTIFIATEKGVTKTVKLDCDPLRRSLDLVPVITSSDFLRDTVFVCGRKDISPAEACETLVSLASSVEKSKSDGKTRVEIESLETYLKVLNRLHNWGLKRYRKNWGDIGGHLESDHLRHKDLDDTKFFAKDPSYSALKLDAETLLRELPKEGRHKKVKDIGDNLGDDDKK